MVMHTSRLAEAGLFITPARGKWRAGEGRRGRLSADSATLINVIWSWQWTRNSSRPWSSCRSPLPVPNSPNYRNIAQQIKCGVICRLARHFIIHPWQRVRGPLLDCLTWHLRAVPFIIVCIYRNERAGYFVKPVIKSSLFFSFLLPHTEDGFSSLAGKWQPGEEVAGRGRRKNTRGKTSCSVTASLSTERGWKTPKCKKLRRDRWRAWVLKQKWGVYRVLV